MKIKVDRDLCISVAACIAVAPNTFELDDEGIAVVKKGKIDNEKDIIQAAKSCPVDAIILHDNNGKQIYPKK